MAPKGMRPLEKMTEVLVHWKDGLYYLGSITKIDRVQETCSVVFEDSSVDVIKMKDVYPRVSEDSEISCDVCNQERSEEPNEIVLCDNCHYGYHQSCHVPPINGDALLPGVPWHCRRCIFNAGVHAGGAEKVGLLADMMKAVKHHLPYEMELLQWDSAHRVNEDDTYCYCGGPGEWFKRMLQCCRCLQWFHEACLQCLDGPVLYGDRNFIFVCLVCNTNHETIERLPISRVDMVNLALFNMNMVDSSKNYFESTEEITKWLSKHWVELTCSRSNPLSQRAPFSEEEVKTILLDNPARFISGQEMRKSRNMFALRVRAPPPRHVMSRNDPASSSSASAEWDRRWPSEPAPEHCIGRKRKRRSMLPPDSPPAVQTKLESVEPSDSAAEDPIIVKREGTRGWSRRRGRGFSRMSRGRGSRSVGQPTNSESTADISEGAGISNGSGINDVSNDNDSKSFLLPQQPSLLTPVLKKRGRPPGFGRARFVVPNPLARRAGPLARRAGPLVRRAGRVGRLLSTRGKKYMGGRLLSAIGARSVVSLAGCPSAGRRRIGVGRGRGRGGRGRGRGAAQFRIKSSETPEIHAVLNGEGSGAASAAATPVPFESATENENAHAATPATGQSYSPYQGNRSLPEPWENDELFSSTVSVGPLSGYFDGPSTSAPDAAATSGQGDRSKDQAGSGYRRMGGRGNRRLLSLRGRIKPVLSAVVRKPPALSLRRPRGRPRRGSRASFSGSMRGALVNSAQMSVAAIYNGIGDDDDGSDAPPKKKPTLEDNISTTITATTTSTITTTAATTTAVGNDGKGDAKVECFCNSMMPIFAASSGDRTAAAPAASAADKLFRESPEELRLCVQNALGAPQVVASGSAVFHLTARRFVDGRSSPEYLVEHESAIARHIGIPM